MIKIVSPQIQVNEGLAAILVSWLSLSCREMDEKRGRFLFFTFVEKKDGGHNQKENTTIILAKKPYIVAADYQKHYGG